MVVAMVAELAELVEVEVETVVETEKFGEFEWLKAVAEEAVVVERYFHSVEPVYELVEQVKKQICLPLLLAFEAEWVWELVVELELDSKVRADFRVTVWLELQVTAPQTFLRGQKPVLLELVQEPEPVEELPAPAAVSKPWLGMP